MRSRDGELHLSTAAVQQLAEDAIGLFLEYRDVHGGDESAAATAALLEVFEGLQAMEEMAAYHVDGHHGVGHVKTYVGKRRDGDVDITVDTGSRMYPLRHIVCHSPTGMAWGYPGSEVAVWADEQNVVAPEDAIGL